VKPRAFQIFAFAFVDRPVRGRELDGERVKQVLAGSTCFALGYAFFVKNAFVRGVLVYKVEPVGSLANDVGGKI
jgi:hypothetical protein